MWGEPSPPGGVVEAAGFDWTSLAPVNRHVARRVLHTDWITGLVEESCLFNDGFVTAKHAERDEPCEEHSDDAKTKKEHKPKVCSIQESDFHFFFSSSIDRINNCIVRGLGTEALWSC